MALTLLAEGSWSTVCPPAVVINEASDVAFPGGIAPTVKVCDDIGVLKQFSKWNEDTGVPGLDLPGLNTVPAAASYGVDARCPRFRRRPPGWQNQASPIANDPH